MNNDSVPNTILSQLGGGRRLGMFLGAKEYVCSEDSLSFRFTARGAKGINKVNVRLDPSDTYTVQFFRATKAGVKLVTEESDVYCDQLVSVLEQKTGLYLHF